MLGSLRAAVGAARRHDSLYFAALLSEERILEAFGSARFLWQGWVYTPAVTVWVFLSQCLSPDHSCRDAVARLIAALVSQGREPCSAETGAYCTARDALPEEACHQLVCQTGADLEKRAPQSGFGIDGVFASPMAQRSRCPTPPPIKPSILSWPARSRAAVFQSRGPSCCFRWPWERFWKRPWASMKGSRPAKTACCAVVPLLG